jgi:aspartyl-tRNA(Asn)/glutamyl-tRNA(Gln) amidotransferase subunit C
MHITEEKIQELAALAQLELTATEKKRFAEDLDQIIAFVEQLQKIDTTGVRPEGVIGPLDHRRRDEPAETDSESVMRGVPSTEAGAVKSPRILT